ncbi:hypothetical protein TNCV_4991141 [Trichonephila clavipes]|nr:hypothetical protein TNCV_4991141 [Trichonephila clavipes]
MKLLFGALCALLVALPALGFPTPEKEVPPQCIDPTFACQDLQSAKLCKVVKTCIHDVWSTMSVPDSNDEVCDICKEMVKEARDQLLSNMTQEEIKEVFEGSCKLLPVKLIADACIKVVDEIIPQLVEMLASRMDPTMVCTVSGMCFPSKEDMTVEKHILKFVRDFMLRQKNDQCSECTQMITDVQVFLKSSTQAEVKTYVEKLCHEKLPSYLCDVVVNSYFSEIYKLILNSAPEELCASVGVCPQKCEVLSDIPKVGDELTCEFCEHLLQHVKDLITANTTLEEFKTALLNFCKVTGKFADKCTNLVNDYYDMLFSYIKQLDTRGMCTLMGLCDKTSCSRIPLVKVLPPLEPQKRIPLIQLRPAQPINDRESFPLVRLVPAEMTSKKTMKDSNDIFQLPVERLTHPLLQFQQDGECALCKAFAFFLEKELQEDRSKVGVQNAINGICEKWMMEYPDACNYIVAKYSLKMQMAVARGVSFDDLCMEVKVCPVEQNKTDDIKVKVVSGKKDSPLCKLCKDALTDIEEVLNDPNTRKIILDSLDKFCNVFPDFIKEPCTSLIGSNVDQLLDILQQELKPDNVCPALGVCADQLRALVSPRVKDLECDVCKDVVTSFRTKLQDPASKEMIMTFLEEGCMRLPDSIASECKKFVDDNIDYLMKMIVEEMDPQKVCSILKICPAQVRFEKTQGVVNDVECELCKEVISKVEELVKDQKTEDEIKAALDKVCSYLPSSISDKCVSFVNQYTNLVVTLLMEELDPDMVCQALKLCPEKVKIEKPKDVECDLCKEVVGKVEDMIKDKKTEDEIKNALDKVCSYLPSSMSAKCVNFVNQYTDLLVTLIIQELDPSDICAKLNLCVSVVEVEKPKDIKDLECDLCKELVTKLEDMIKDKSTEEEIKTALDKVCSYLPSSMSNKCQNFVNQYTDLLVEILSQEINPDLVCAALKVCPTTPQLSQWKSKAVDLECQGCQYALHFLQEQLMNNQTQEEVKNVLKKMCEVLPNTYANNCDAFVNEYGSSLLVLIAQEIDPSVLCFELKLCKNQFTIPQLINEVAIPQLNHFHMDECSVCTTVVDYMDKLLEMDDFDTEITKLVEKVCNVLPASYQSRCSTLLETYGPYILQMIGQVTDSKALCQEIDLCPTSPGHVHLIGGSKCTFGPSYWCHSTAHAAACKAEEYCQTKVWLN